VPHISKQRLLLISNNWMLYLNGCVPWRPFMNIVTQYTLSFTLLIFWKQACSILEIKDVLLFYFTFYWQCIYRTSWLHPAAAARKWPPLLASSRHYLQVAAAATASSSPTQDLRKKASESGLPESLIWGSQDGKYKRSVSRLMSSMTDSWNPGSLLQVPARCM